MSFMRVNGLDLEDIKYAFKSGKISKARYEFLMKNIKGRLGAVRTARKVDFDSRPGAASKGQEYQIEKDKEKNSFRSYLIDISNKSSVRLKGYWHSLTSRI